jgi:hypothetical protein
MSFLNINHVFNWIFVLNIELWTPIIYFFKRLVLFMFKINTGYLCLTNTFLVNYLTQDLCLNPNFYLSVSVNISVKWLFFQILSPVSPSTIFFSVKRHNAFRQLQLRDGFSFAKKNLKRKKKSWKSDFWNKHIFKIFHHDLYSSF